MDHPIDRLSKRDLPRLLPYVSLAIFLVLMAAGQEEFGWPPVLTLVGSVLVCLVVTVLVVAVLMAVTRLRGGSRRA